MTFRTHQVGALAAVLTAAVYAAPTNLKAATIITALIANAIGALLPDLDQASNRLWDLLPGGHLWGKILKNIFLGHRTLSHSLLGFFIIYKATFWLIPKLLNGLFIDINIVALALLIGYVSHLILDLITEEGIPLLWPIKWKIGVPPVKWLRIKTGHWVENWLVFPLLVGYILWLGVTSWQKLI